ncbi:MAG: TonB-dependent receptor [Bacteroidales bacterium]|nr:TonB-dependent receptor [Bacteroidales bacterium]
MKTTISILLIVICATFARANDPKPQKYKQTIRGLVIDAVTKTSLPGANVILADSDPLQGSATDYEGKFRIEDVAIGRISLYVTLLGYEPKRISNLIVTSAKEVVLTIEMTESLVKLEEVTINGHKNKQEAINKMAMLSAKTFTVEETSRYAGSFNDAARMVSAYAGVSGLSFGNNDIVVRGNSPKGILWRLEGVEIPNPNHFANDGSSGGPISALNSAMLANSDFFTGAFTPEYGNAYSGVFDMKLRPGNNQKREYIFSLGALGTDITMEGPFKKAYSGSYLVNYRYSSLSLIDKMGLVDFGGVPKYQDLSFNIILPTKSKGTLSLFGLGGISSITTDWENDDHSLGTMEGGSDMGVVGLKHTYPISSSWFVKNMLVANGTRINNKTLSGNNAEGMRIDYEENIENTELKYISEINGKFNSRNSFKAGLIYTQMFYSIQSQLDRNKSGVYENLFDANGNAGRIQAFANWQHRLNEKLSFTAGSHYLHFLLNNNFSIEPRMALKWQFTPTQSFTIGGGLHSKVENLSVYLSNIYEEDLVHYEANKNLDLTKAAHTVIGYTNQFTPNLYIKLEAYYQHLYDVPVENDANSPYVLLNEMNGRSYNMLTNEGTGRNYGIELTLERFFANNYYFMITGSLYDTKFKAKDGVWNNSQYNNHFNGNFLFGKEFTLGKPEKGMILNVNTRLSYTGGMPYSPIDLERSHQERQTVINLDEYMQKYGDGIFNFNLAVGLRMNRRNTSHEIKLDIQNVLNSQATVMRYYDSYLAEIQEVPQLALLPNLMYVIYF